MATPTRDSRTRPLTDEVQALLQVIASTRKLAVNQQAALLTDTPINDILNDIYIPLVQDTGFLESIKRVRSLGNFNRLFLDEVGLHYEIGPSDVNLANERIILGDNNFLVDDPVRFVEHDVLPSPFVEGTTYFVLDKPTTGTIRLSATVGGSAINISSKGTGQNNLRFALNPELNAVETAIEDVIDEVIVITPVVASSSEIKARTFDKLLATSTDGLADEVLTSSTTATLRTLLLDLQDTIEAPL